MFRQKSARAQKRRFLVFWQVRKWDNVFHLLTKQVLERKDYIQSKSSDEKNITCSCLKRHKYRNLFASLISQFSKLRTIPLLETNSLTPSIIIPVDQTREHIDTMKKPPGPAKIWIKTTSITKKHPRYRNSQREMLCLTCFHSYY